MVKPESRAPGGGNKNEDVVMKKAPPAAAAFAANQSYKRPAVLKSGRTAKKLAAKKSWLAGKKHTSEKKELYAKRSKTFQDFRKEHKGKFSEESPAIFDGPGKKSSSKATTPYLSKQKETSAEMRNRRKEQKKKFVDLSSKFKTWRASN